MKHQSTLSVIITALNEEKNVFPFLTRLKEFLVNQKINHEVIFVDDGSTDNTLSEAERFSDWEELRVIRLVKNVGTGGAVKEALKFARGQWYGWLPCDLEIMPEELLRPLEKIDGQDVVVTYFESGHEARSLGRRFLSVMFTGILNLCFNQKLPYYNGLSLIRRELIDESQIVSHGFFFHAELLIRVLRKSNKVVFVPIHLSPRLAEKPKALKFKVLSNVISSFLRILWEVKIK